MSQDCDAVFLYYYWYDLLLLLLSITSERAQRSLFNITENVKISDPGHSMSRHKVMSSDLIPEKMNARHSYTECPIILKLSVIDIRNSIYKMYISEFWWRWPKVRSFSRPLHFKSTGEKFQTQVTHCHVTRSCQVTSSQKNECSSYLHRMPDHFETFSDWYPKQYL